MYLASRRIQWVRWCTAKTSEALHIILWYLNCHCFSYVLYECTDRENNHVRIQREDPSLKNQKWLQVSLGILVWKVSGGPPAKRHLNDVSLAGRWWLALSIKVRTKNKIKSSDFWTWTILMKISESTYDNYNNNW